MKLQQFRKFTPNTYIQPQRTRLIIQSFTLPVPPWTGASTLLAEYALSNTNHIAFRKPIKKFGANFVAAVRWEEDNVYYRFVFWVDPLAVLYFPTYNGETLGPNAVIEIWSVNSSSPPATTTNTLIESSTLIFPSEGCSFCCFQPNGDVLLIQSGPIVLPPGVCNPFCSCEAIPGTGACIVGVSCTITTRALCLAAGGVYQGDGTTCAVVPPYSLPAWPVPVPFACAGDAIFGPMFITDPITSQGSTPGIAPGAMDPLTYLATWGLPGCLEAWSAAVWLDFTINGPPHTQARLIWADSHTAGFDFQAIQVYPNLVAPYAHVIDADTKIMVEYCPL